MAWKRRSGWYLDEEHFHYDAKLRRFVVEEPRQPPRAAPASRRGKVWPSDYLAALAEIRREVQHHPADEWESGLLIQLYAETIFLQAARPTTASVPPPDIDQVLSGSDVMRYEQRLDERLPELIVAVAEAMIRRHAPEATEAVSVCLEDRDPGVTVRLNHIADSIHVPNGRAMLTVWLASFDRPDYSEDWSLSDKLAAKGSHATDDFVQACATLAKDILAAGGNVATSLTVGNVADRPTKGNE